MKINVNINPQELSKVNIPKKYDLGSVQTTLQDLLNNAEITIEDNLLPILVINNVNYMLPDLSTKYATEEWVSANVPPNSTYLGSVTPTSTPTGTGANYWTATQNGTYANFGGMVVATNSIAIIGRNSVGAFSISQTALDLSTYALKTYVDRADNNFRAIIPTAGYDFANIVNSGVYLLSGTYLAGALVNAPSFFSVTRRIRGTLTFNKSTLSGNSGSTFLLNFIIDPAGTQYQIFGVLYNGVYYWMEQNIPEIKTSITVCMQDKGIITDEGILAKDLSIGLYRTGKQADYPNDITSIIGTASCFLEVKPISAGKLYNLRVLQAGGNAELFFNEYKGRIFNTETSITWYKSEAIESNYFFNKKVIVTGDSIASSFSTVTALAFNQITKRILQNSAFGGSGLANRTTGDLSFNNWSFVGRSYTGATNIIDVTNANQLVVWAGYNDITADVPLGTLTSTDITTIAGAINVGVANYLTRSPFLNIVFFTPSANPYKQATPNALGLRMSDYVAHIKLVCENLSIKVVPMDKMSNINETNKANILTDTIHPVASWHNETGLKILLQNI